MWWIYTATVRGFVPGSASWALISEARLKGSPQLARHFAHDYTIGKG